MKYLSIIMIFLSSVVFADMTQDGLPIVYCPQYVECTAGGKLDSCKVSDDEYGLWGNRQAGDSYEGRVVKGVYFFVKAAGGYGRDTYEDSRHGIYCAYKQVDSLGVERFISLHSDLNSRSDFEALLTEVPQWWSVRGWSARCESDNHKLCPFVELKRGITCTPMNELCFDKKMAWDSTAHTSYLDYDYLLSICGATSSCKINLHHRRSNEYGQAKTIQYETLTLDLISSPSHVKIVDIHPEFSEHDTPCVFKQKKPFNAIYCEPKNESTS